MNKQIIRCLIGTGFISVPALAQTVPPFFGPGVVAYDPQPAIVESGALLNPQAVVSEDRRYVTITSGAVNTRLRALTQFPVVSAQGFVGGANLDGQATNFSVQPSPDQIDRQGKSWILARQGMYLVKPLD
ncbi:MAG TPA: hypothetical protein VKK61_02590 [Tepidisphaeraceae bacterium]|jgi:hypothetical protein|nr:hypothetical protein [Tepidisphaeraceae bacterium]